MRRILAILLILFMLVPLGLIGNSSADVTPPDEPLEVWGPSWLDTEMDLEPMSAEDLKAASRSQSRAMNVPPVQMQQAISHIVDQVSEAHLEDHLNKLVGFGSRLYRAPGMYNASEWLHDSLNGYGGITAEYHNFTVVRPTWGTFVLNNVILTIPGKNVSSDRIYYMFAHSDARQDTDSNQWLTNTPGADDDGSGCVAVLEAARTLARYDFHDTIKFAFFNAEEIGLIGSARYAQTMAARNENVPASIDYDMIGYSNGNPQYGIDLTYNPANAPLASYVIDANDRYDIGLTITPTQKTGSIATDIQSFYNNGFPGVFGIESNFSPYYHSTSDLVKYINFSLIEKSTKLAVANLAEWARLIYTDLSIPDGNINVTDISPNEDDDVNITVNVTNTGNFAAHDVEILFANNGMPVDTTLMSIPINGSNETTITWKAETGAHNMTITVDPKNEVVETDETNNTAFIHINVNDRPRAVLTAVPMSVLTNETITFDSSLSWDEIGGITGYDFDYGDGSGSGWQATPTTEHSYPADGNYTASVTVMDVRGAQSESVQLNVEVLNRPPLASPGSNLSRALTLTPIQFMSNATDPDGFVMVQWDFGDGSDSGELEPVHAYLKSGSYDVILSLLDDDGAAASYALWINIDNRKPIAMINASAISGNVETSFTFEAVAVDHDGKIIAYQWDFGDGSTSVIDTNHYKFKRPGTYIVKLMVRDDEGAEGTASVVINIIDLFPVAIAEAVVNEARTGEMISFLGDQSYDLEGPVTYSWDFDDGNTSSDANPKHAYAKVGNYSVKFTATDSAGQSNTTTLKPVLIKNRSPQAEFGYFGSLKENGTVYFDGSDSSDPEGEVSYSWDFGDDGKGTGKIPEHVYSEPGEYIVYLTVTDEHGSTSTVQKHITIESIPLPPPVTEDKEKEEDNNSLMTNSLLALNFIWIILLIIVVIWSVTRRKKDKSEEQQVKAMPQDWPEAAYTPIYPTQLPPGMQDPQQMQYPEAQPAAEAYPQPAEGPYALPAPAFVPAPEPAPAYPAQAAPSLPPATPIPQPTEPATSIPQPETNISQPEASPEETGDEKEKKLWDL